MRRATIERLFARTSSSILAASSGSRLAAASNFALILSMCIWNGSVFSLYQHTAEKMDPAAVNKWHTQQRTQITAHKMPTHEIPSDYACAGPCTLPPPQVPVSTQVPARPVPEVFTDGPTPLAQRYWALMSVAALSFAFITMRGAKRG